MAKDFADLAQEGGQVAIDRAMAMNGTPPPMPAKKAPREQIADQVPTSADDMGPPPPKAPLLPIVRLCDLPEPGPVKWLIDELWADAAFGIVGAEPKSWKSYLIIYLSICVATGRKAFDRFAVRKGKVLMFSAEGGTVSLRRRLGQLCRALDIAIPADIHAIDVPMLRIDDPAMVASITATVESVRPVMVVLDPLRELHAGDENAADAIAGLLGPLRTLTRMGCAVVLVHHFTKAPSDGRNARRNGQRLRGSSALHGAVDSALYLASSGTGEGKRVRVEAEHRDGAEPEPFTLAMRRQATMTGDAVWLEIVADEGAEEREADLGLAAYQAQRRKILRVITNAAMPGREPLRSKRGVVAAAKVSPKIAGPIIDALLEEGAIVLKKGAYQPAQEVV